MSKTKNKEIKKTTVEKNDEDFLEEETDNKKSIIIIICAIVLVIVLIIGSVYLFGEGKKESGKKEVEIKLPTEEDNVEEEKEASVEKVTSKTVAETTKYNVVYLDKDAKQIGETQVVLKLENRVDEDAPHISGHRFIEWIEYYNEKTNTYYYAAYYRKNVERIPLEDEVLLDEEDENKEGTYDTVITEVETIEVENEQGEIEEVEPENPTYDVKIEGEVEELEPEDIDEELTIDEDYAHIIALRFNAPEGITKEQIEKMEISVKATDPNETINDEQYDLNAEDPTLTGKELLDSTPEEYENNEFYFYYYQEADTKTNTTIEVYWGNDPEADKEANPEVEPSPEYVEVYNIDLKETELEDESVEE